MATLVILRFFCGVFGSSGPALGVATIADIWAPEERGRPISIYAIGPMAGPVLGSMMGYWILYGGWRWLFWTITTMSAINLGLFIILTDETYAPAIEKVLIYRVRHPLLSSDTISAKLSPKRIIHDLGWMSVMVSADDARVVFRRAFSRPPRILFGNPVAFMFSAYYAYIYGQPSVFRLQLQLIIHSQRLSTSSWSASPCCSDLHRSAVLVCSRTLGRSQRFLSATSGWVSLSLFASDNPCQSSGSAIGFAIAATTAANAQDKIYKYLKKRNGDVGGGQPEYRVRAAPLDYYKLNSPPARPHTNRDVPNATRSPDFRMSASLWDHQLTNI